MYYLLYLCRLREMLRTHHSFKMHLCRLDISQKLDADTVPYSSEHAERTCYISGRHSSLLWGAHADAPRARHFLAKRWYRGISMTGGNLRQIPFNCHSIRA